MSIFERGRERSFVNQAAARAIDDADAAFCLCNSRGIENVTSFIRQRRMQRNEVRVGEQIVELFHEFDL